MNRFGEVISRANVVTKARGKLGAVVVACLLAGPVLPQKAQAQKHAEPDALCPPCLHDQVLQGLPESIEAVVAVNDGARQRNSAAGKALANVIAESGALSETILAWRELSRTLEWTPEKTFDELLGRRISLVARGLSAPEGPEWVVLGAVSGPTQKRLRERLRAAPRGAVAGLSVLAIEDGSFQLVIAPCLEAAGRGEDASVILLAPRRSEALMEEIAPALRGMGPVPELPPGRPCDVVVAVRRAGQPRSLAITARAVDAGWDASIVCESRLVLDRPLKVADVRTWRDSVYRDLEPGSILAVMSIEAFDALAVLPQQIGSWKRAVAGLRADPAEKSAALRTAVFVRAIGPGPAQPDPSGFAYAHKGPAGAPTAPRGRLAVSVLCESQEPRRTLVKGDQAMARMARLLMTGKPEVEPAAPNVQLEILDNGPRTLRLGEDLTVHPELESRMARAFGDSPLLSWNMFERRDGAGWWVGSISPSDAGPLREQRLASSPETGPSRARLSIGMIRPAAVERWVGAVDPELLGSIAGARFIESVRWDSWLRDDGRVEATVNLRMAVPTGK